MKYLLTIALLLAISGSMHGQYRKMETGYFRVEVVQDGNVVPRGEDSVVIIKPAPFKLKIWYKNDESIGEQLRNGLVYSASYGKYYYDYPDYLDICKCNLHRSVFASKENLAAAACRFYGNKRTAIDVFNSDRRLKVGGGDYANDWSIDWGNSNHTMDHDLRVEKTQVWAEYSVDSLLNLDTPGVQHVSSAQDDIYFVIAKDSYYGEVQRDKFILRFEGVPELRNSSKISIESELSDFIDQVIKAALAKDSHKLMSMLDEEYIKKQHDQFHNGNTKRFLNELFWLPLESIKSMKQARPLEQYRSGHFLRIRSSDGNEEREVKLFLKQKLNSEGKIVFTLVGSYG